MTALDPKRAGPEEAEETGKSGGHSRWMMVVCCIPMLAIAVLIALSGAGLGFLIIALVCTAMMAAMMGLMVDGESQSGGSGGSDAGE